MNKVTYRHQIEFGLVILTGLGLYLPFLAQQYDTNGIIEALAVDSGQLFHKNHLLYRYVGYLANQGLQLAGYSGRSIVVMQMINAICGALGVGFAFLTYKRIARNTKSAVAGSALLACSFTYWLFSTDAAYITLAAMFASASMALLLILSSPASAVLAGIMTTLSVLTWQGSVFLIPALAVLYLQTRTDVSPNVRVQATGIYIGTGCIISGLAYTFTAFGRDGAMGLSGLLRWVTSYGESGTLPMWGQWQPQRVLIAFGSALRSLIPTPLAVPVNQLSWDTQRGRIAVDLAIGLILLLILMAVLKIRGTSLSFLVAYFVFLPFITWWDPFEPKWFIVPNLFLAGFFATALEPWLRTRLGSGVVLGSVLFIAATNFITTIRPRHQFVGQDRLIAECVAQNMHPNDLLIAAEWGWPDYLEYLHGRMSLSLIGNAASVDGELARVHRTGGKAFMLDPETYSDAHLSWLQSQSGVSRKDLIRLADAPAFSCYGRRIFSLRE